MSIKKLSIVILFFIYSLSAHTHGNSYTIMLDPAGDARHTGRIIGTSFERALTFQIAQALQQTLQKTFPSTVIITRSPGETVHQRQSANFANRLPIDLYISLHCYHAPQEKHTIALYLLSRSTLSIPSSAPISMMPFDHAHWQSFDTTKKYGALMHNTLQTYAHQFQLPPVITLPFAPLLGIQAPAIGIEINCVSPDNVTLYVEPLAKTIISALTS